MEVLHLGPWLPLYEFGDSSSMRVYLINRLLPLLALLSNSLILLQFCQILISNMIKDFCLNSETWSISVIIANSILKYKTVMQDISNKLFFYIYIFPYSHEHLLLSRGIPKFSPNLERYTSGGYLRATHPPHWALLAEGLSVPRNLTCQYAARCQ